MNLQLILAIFPIAINIAQMIESQFPQGGNGASKLELAKGLISDIYNDSTDLKAHGDLPTIIGVAVKVIGHVVNFLNSVGVFKPSPKA